MAESFLAAVDHRATECSRLAARRWLGAPLATVQVRIQALLAAAVRFTEEEMRRRRDRLMHPDVHFFSFDKPTQDTMLGLRLSRREPPRIDAIGSAGLIAAMGFDMRIGDALLSINGDAYAGHEEATTCLRGSAGAIEIFVGRQGRFSPAEMWERQGRTAFSREGLRCLVYCIARLRVLADRALHRLYDVRDGVVPVARIRSFEAAFEGGTQTRRHP